jgi:hypothetical protein
MALSFSNDEMTVLLSLARPIAPEQRPQFIDAVAAAIEARGGPSGPGVVHQVGRLIQRQFWEPPSISPNASAPQHHRVRV